MAVNKNIAVTVDTVIFGVLNEKRTHLLLIQRRNDPFKGQWAFPGGFLDEDEDLHFAAARELREETGLKVDPEKLIQIGAFGKPDRDPRGRTISIAFKAEVNKDTQPVQGGDDASKAQWWPLAELPELAFDHQMILNRA